MSARADQSPRERPPEGDIVDERTLPSEARADLDTDIQGLLLFLKEPLHQFRDFLRETPLDQVPTVFLRVTQEMGPDRVELRAERLARSEVPELPHVPQCQVLADYDERRLRRLLSTEFPIVVKANIFGLQALLVSLVTDTARSA